MEALATRLAVSPVVAHVFDHGCHIRLQLLLYQGGILLHGMQLPRARIRS